MNPRYIAGNVEEEWKLSLAKKSMAESETPRNSIFHADFQNRGRHIHIIVKSEANLLKHWVSLVYLVVNKTTQVTGICVAIRAC